MKVTYTLEVPVPVDPADVDGVEAILMTRVGEIPFVPAAGTMINCGDGDLRRVEEVYWFAHMPNDIQIHFEDSDYEASTARWAELGWTEAAC